MNKYYTDMYFLFIKTEFCYFKIKLDPLSYRILFIRFQLFSNGIVFSKLQDTVRTEKN